VSSFVQKWIEYFRPAKPPNPVEQLIPEIRRRQGELGVRNDNELQALAQTRARGLPPEDAFALATEAVTRTLGMRPFDVQILGAIAMRDGKIAEMQTGEGKTLTAVLAVFALALQAASIHVLTANDYLARRDARWMGDAYRFLGLSVGYLQQGMTVAERRAMYACDVLYATANEIGFDYLRDGLALTPDDLVQRPFEAALVDEADSILIDEARIPLVIAGGDAAPQDLAKRAAALARALRQYSDYMIGENGRNVRLTDAGIAAAEYALGVSNLFDDASLPVLTAVQDAIHAHALLRRDVDYVVKNGAIELVDEYKGRIAENRRWPAGLQTAIEAKEGVALKRQGRILASVTLQSLIRMYPFVCGMTGTAATQRNEFREFYGLEVVEIPTNRPVIRVDHPDVVFRGKAVKEEAIVQEICATHVTGRPILVGTASVAESERLSARLNLASVPHQVLNARNEEAEAAIVARAGSLGAVTISTNMAGRGTDIPLVGTALPGGTGLQPVHSDPVRELGGLYVIGTNRHESRRIDNQLRGRSGRQGDPGSSRFFVSLEDDLMRRYGIEDILGGVRDLKSAGNAISQVQRIIEGQHLEIRKTLQKYDKVIEQQRRRLRDRRQSVLLGDLEPENPELHAKLGQLLGEEPARDLERKVELAKIDELWSDYMAEVDELRHGIYWQSWAAKDPLNTFLKTVFEWFEQLEQRIDDEIRETLESVMLEDGRIEMPKLFDRGATWTYVITDMPFGTLQERWMRAIGGVIKKMLMEGTSK
jgi:preprotein translocase subunit SecA